jgi:negative regulator of flagellin synthesis FlgM
MPIDNIRNLNTRTGADSVGRAKVKGGESSSGAAAKSPAPAAGSGATVNISNESRSVEALKAHVAELPEVNAKLVESIKSAIAAGEYHIDPDKVARKMLSIEGELLQRK